MKRNFLTFICTIFLTFPGWAAKIDFPNLNEQVVAETGVAAPNEKAAETEFPKLTGQVVDEAGVLTSKEKAVLENILAADKENQIVVAIVKNLRGKEGREYGVDLARHWQLGQKEKDNGVLILMSVGDRYVGIETGYGLEGILTDSISGRILQNEVLPYLKGQNPQYGAAMMNAATSVMSVISQAKEGGSDENGEDLLSLLFLLLIIFIVMSGRLPRGGGGGMFFGGGRGMGGGGFSGGGGSFGGGGAGRRF